MDELDQLLSDTPSAPPSGMAQQQSATVAPPKGLDDLDLLLNDGIKVDELTGEPIPLAFSGATPETAMNKSVLSAADRLKLSVGNLQGNVQYLSKKFGIDHVKQIKDREGNPTRELAIFENGAWHRVDPENGQIADPWEKTKEYLKDAAEFAPEALGVAAASGTAFATGGLSLPQSAAVAGATSGAVRTSLGRIVGTYEATPAEQAWDIGFEALLNAAGVKILAGVKPTAKWVADRLEPLAEAFKSGAKQLPGSEGAGKVAQAIADTPMNLYKKVFGGYSVGEQNFDEMLKNPKAVKSIMQSAYAQTGTNTEAYHNLITERQVQAVKDTVLSTPKILTDIYGSMRNEILASTPDNFVSNLDDTLFQSYGNAIQKGIGQIVVTGRKMGAQDAVSEEFKQVLRGTAAMDYLAKNNLKNVRFELIPKKEFVENLPVASDIGNEAAYLAHSNAYNELKTYYDKLNLFAGGKDRTGREGAKALLDFKKVATDIAWELENQDSVKSLTGIRDIIAQSRTSIDNAIHNGLKAAGGKQAETFRKMNSTYSELMQEMKPVLNVVKQYRNTENDKVFEILLNKFTTKGGKNVSEKGAFEGARSVAEQYGLPVAKQLADAQNYVRVGEAAKAFNPIKPGLYKADAIGTSQLGIAMYGVASQNPALLATTIGMQTLRSPSTARAAIATVQGLMKGQQMVSNMSKKQLNAFLSNPELMQKYMTGVTSSPLVYEQANQQLQSIMSQATQGQGQ